MNFGGKRNKRDNELQVVGRIQLNESVRPNARLPGHGQRQSSSRVPGSEITRENKIFAIDFASYLANKGPNHNITVTGQAGSGKTQLIYWLVDQMVDYKKIIFSYKDSDEFNRLGYPVLFLKKYSPDVFSDPEAFTQAWLVAFGVEREGITASAIEPVVRDIVKNCRNWQEFLDEVEKRIKRNQRNYILLGTLNDIRAKLDSVYNERIFSYDLPEEVVIDFSQLNESAFTFFAEYLLRSLYNKIRDGTREGTMLFVDEGHLFLKSRRTIVKELAAVIRSRGAFLLATQKLTDLVNIRGNAGIQFTFRLTEMDDLQAARSLSQEFQWIVQRLYPYEFVDLAQYASENGIYIFRLNNPRPELYDVNEWKPDGMSEEAGVVVKEADMEGPDRANLTMEQVVLEQLSEPRNAQEIAKKITEKTGEDVNTVRFDITATNGPIDRLMRQGKITSFKLDYVKFVNNRAYVAETEATYYCMAGTYDAHDFVVSMVAAILTRKGTDCRVMFRGESYPDIIAGKISVEIEMGDKRGENLEKVKKRIEDQKKNGYSVIIVTPSQDLKSKYREIEEVSILTPKELWQLNLSGEEHAQREKKV